MIGGAVLAVVMVVALVLAIVPVDRSGLGAQPDPVDSYDEAVARFEEIRAGEDVGNVYEPCESVLLDRGERTRTSIVLFHGLTNCPVQFRELGEELHAGGANVLILRAPRHGLADSSGQQLGDVSEVGDLTAAELRDFADSAVDIGVGLGDDVKVMGLSMGGVLSLWTAVFRPDVDDVVAVAPAISIPRVPHFLTTAFVNMFGRLPNFSLPSPAKLDHAYHGESTGALAAMFTLAQATGNELVKRPAAVDAVTVVLNPDDPQVDNGEVERLISGWTTANGAPVETDFFPAVGLPHDLVDPGAPTADPGLVYPILSRLIEADSEE